MQSAVETQATWPITLIQIQQGAHEQNATLVEYSIVSSDRLYIWVISPLGS